MDLEAKGSFISAFPIKTISSGPDSQLSALSLSLFDKRVDLGLF